MENIHENNAKVFKALCDEKRLAILEQLRKAVKPKLLTVFIGICILGIIIVGYLFNQFSYLLL